MIVAMKEMLAEAQKHRYAIPAFDVSNYEMMRAVLEVCEEERSPVLLMGLGVDLEGKGLLLTTSMVKAASGHCTVPFPAYVFEDAGIRMKEVIYEKISVFGCRNRI